MNIKKFSWFLLYFIAAAIPSIFYIIETINNGNTNQLYSLSGILGIISYSMLSFQFLLVSRPKIIDKYFGLDRIYSFHIIIAIIALLLALIHNLLKGYLNFSDSFQTFFGSTALISFAVISALSILLMVNKLFFRLKIINSIRKFLNNLLSIKYETKILFHNLTIASLIALLIHVLMASSIRYNKLLMIIMIIYFIVPSALYFNRKIINPYFNKKSKYIISDIINESHNIITLRLSPTHSKIIKYMPGQFVYLKIDNPEVPKDEHPFTLSSTPTENEYISVTIKQLGDFTKSLAKVKKGNKVYIDGSYGIFSYVKNTKFKKLFFIAGGIGITPFISMLRYIYAIDKNKDITLLWGVKDTSEIICNDEIMKYTSELNTFKFIPILSNTPSYDGEKGFIDIEKIKKYTDDVSDYDFYICGPPAMLEIELSNLKALKVHKDKIHYERFGM